MIGPAEILRKAENLYPRFLRAHVRGEEMFPHEIRSEKRLGEDVAEAAKAVSALRAASKETVGYGYSLEWTERASRRYGRNAFPSRIFFESRTDFLRYVRKEKEFEAFDTSLQAIRARRPEFENWMRANVSRLIKLGADVHALLDVVDRLEKAPRPDLFARELSLPTDTKFVERHETLLREWLDVALPPETIDASEERFARRFGLRFVEPLIRLRFLDEDLRRTVNVPWNEFGLPLRMLASAPIPADCVTIVENQVNLLTLPPLRRGLALGGLGHAASDLRHAGWLHDVDLRYWGDIDVDGFAILSRLRMFFPHVTSVLMDVGTLERSTELRTSGHGRATSEPPNLTIGELAAFRRCNDENLRIEQERIHPRDVIEAFAKFCR